MRAGLSFLGLVLAAAVLVGGSCGPSSCVQFDAQSIRARHDAARDRVDLLLVYRGLTTQPGGDAGKAVDLLAEIRDKRNTFALIDNFPLTLEERGPGATQGAAAAALWSLLLRDVALTNGLLWRDERGRLCASQLIRVAHVSEVLVAANAAITEGFREELGRALRKASPPVSRGAGTAAGSPPPAASQAGAADSAATAASPSLSDWFSVERLQRCVTAGGGGYRFLSLRGSALAFSLPVVGDDAGQFRRAVLAGLRHELDAQGAEPEGWDVDLIARNRIALDQVGDDLQIVLGDPAEAELHVESPPRGQSGNDLGGELAARGWAVAGPEGEALAGAAFEAFRAQP